MESGSATGTIVLNRAALHEQICDAIRERIILGEYQPGRRLNIDQLARDMGVSTTPVREALARLISERLVQFQSNRGYSVTPPPDAEWMSDLFEVRRLVEPYAAGVGASRADPSLLAEMEGFQARLAALDMKDIRSIHKYIQLNQRFHNLIVDSAGNRPLSEQYKMLSYHAQIALIYALGLNDIPQVLDEHVPIIDAYRACDGPAAESAMRQHIEQGRNRAVAFIAAKAPAATMVDADTRAT